MNNTWKLEPAMIIGFVTALLTLFVAFGVPVTTEQQESIKTFVTALLPIVGAVVIRSQVTPNAKVEAEFGPTAVEAAGSVTRSMLP